MRQHKIFQNKPKAFLLEEGGAALAVTEGAAREQVCIRVTLIRQGKSAVPSKMEPSWLSLRESWHLQGK